MKRTYTAISFQQAEIKMIDVEPTAQAIDLSAKTMLQAADRLNNIAAKIREENDLTYAADAISEILNALQNSRVDLLVTRPIRALGAESQ